MTYTKDTTLFRFTTESQTTHGESGKNSTPEYRSYSHAKARCNNPNNHAYKDYGGRGIEFRFTSFEEFLEHLGRRPSLKYTLDRFPNKNGHYEKDNVRWATKKEQANHRRNSHLVTLNGITATLSEWSAHYNLPISRTSMRLQRGYCYECIFTLPKGEACKHRSTASPSAVTADPTSTTGV